MNEVTGCAIVPPCLTCDGHASLANLLPREFWDRLRREAYRRAGYCCRICNRRARLHCHEIWCFNDRTECQTLLGFEALCEDCHHVKHIFPIRSREEYIRSLRHLVEVNGFTDPLRRDLLSGNPPSLTQQVTRHTMQG